MKAIIVAMDKNRVIGKDGKIPWHLPNDLKHFRELTMGHVIIMGRKTFESIGKPLPGRVNVVLTRQKNYAPQGVVVHHSLEDALSVFADSPKVFIIGGAEIYREALPLMDKLYVTEINAVIWQGDTYFPEIDNKIWSLLVNLKFVGIDFNRKIEYEHFFLEYEKKV